MREPVAQAALPTHLTFTQLAKTLGFSSSSAASKRQLREQAGITTQAQKVPVADILKVIDLHHITIDRLTPLMVQALAGKEMYLSGGKLAALLCVGTRALQESTLPRIRLHGDKKQFRYTRPHIEAMLQPLADDKGIPPEQFLTQLLEQKVRLCGTAELAKLYHVNPQKVRMWAKAGALATAHLPSPPGARRKHIFVYEI